MKPIVTVSGIEDLAAAIAHALAELRANTAPPASRSRLRESVNPLASLAGESVNGIPVQR